MSRRTYWAGWVLFLLLMLYVGSYLYTLAEGIRRSAPFWN